MTTHVSLLVSSIRDISLSSVSTSLSSVSASLSVYLLVCQLYLPVCQLYLPVCQVYLPACQFYLSVCQLYLSVCFCTKHHNGGSSQTNELVTEPEFLIFLVKKSNVNSRHIFCLAMFYTFNHFFIALLLVSQCTLVV